MTHRHFQILLPLWAVQAVLMLCVQHVPLFWDHILHAGQIPDYFYHHPPTLFVPESIAGYPPLFGHYVAAGWRLLGGQSLPAAHWLMLPFVWGISWQCLRLAQRFVARRALWLTAVALVGLPVLLTLQTQAGPDLPFVFLYLAALNALLARNRGWLMFFTVLLAVLSPRALWSILSLGVIDQMLLGHRVFAWRWVWAIGRALTFLPALSMAAAWYWLQYHHYGWAFASPTGQWSTLAGWATPVEFGRNLLICLWRMGDFGQVIIFICLAALVPGVLRGRTAPLEHRTTLVLLWLVPTATFCVFFSLFRNPVGHRYLILPVVLATLWLCYEWGEQLRYDRFRLCMLGLLLVLGTGHFWVLLYPAHWAKGWDSTLCYLPFGNAKASALRWADEHHIAPEEIEAPFPNADLFHYSYLNGDRRQFTSLEADSGRYFFYTNTANDYPDDIEAILHQKGKKRLRLERWPVWVEVWQRK